MDLGRYFCGSVVQLLAGLISAPYLCFPAWGRKYHMESGTGSGELMAEYLQRESLCCRDVKKQTATQKRNKYKSQQRRVKHRPIPEQTHTTGSFTLRQSVGQTQVPRWRLHPACSTPGAASHTEAQGKADTKELPLTVRMEYQ